MCTAWTLGLSLWLHLRPYHMDAHKVFWIGRHTVHPSWGAPVSKVHSAGLALLKSQGWQEVANDTQLLPVFAFTSRKGANYPADQAGLPPVRQLPHQNSACLDDKRLLHQHLQHAGQAHLLPPSWPSLPAYLSWLQEQGRQTHQQGQGEQQPCAARGVGPPDQQHAPPPPPPQQQDSVPALLSASVKQHPDSSHSNTSNSSDGSSRKLPGSVFVKHRRGVKGQAVYVAHTLGELHQLQQRRKGSAADFVVQQEVAPPMLLHGRKFVLRAHVLVVLRRSAAADAAGAEPTSAAAVPAPKQAWTVGHMQQPWGAENDTLSAQPAPAAGTAAGVDVFVHDDVIVLPHACAYEPCSSVPAVHISSKGSGHPAPFLLQQQLHAGVWPQLQRLSAAAVQAVSHALVPAAIDADVAVLYHLFGFDCMVDAGGGVVLLEANSYPAIASGTMCAVDAGVYTRLLQDMLTLLVLPLADGTEPAAGGFVACGGV